MIRPSHSKAAAKATPLRSPITFRLDQESDAALSERAAALEISPNALARSYVMQALSQAQDRASLSEEIRDLADQFAQLGQAQISGAEAIDGELAKLRNQVDELKASHAAGVEVLLSCAGKVTEARARAWADKNLRRA